MSTSYKRWIFPKHRLETYSDAVFAIVITLLVLELKVPHMEHPEVTQNIINSLVVLAPKIFSWIASFFFVSLIWMHHHHILLMSTEADYNLVWINAFLLFFVCLLPFPTALLGEYPLSPLIITFWGATTAMMALMLAFLYSYITRKFLRPGYDARIVKRNVRLSFFGGPLLYLIAALISWWSVKSAYLLYIVVPLLYIRPLDREIDPGK